MGACASATAPYERRINEQTVQQSDALCKRFLQEHCIQNSKCVESATIVLSSLRAFFHLHKPNPNFLCEIGWLENVLRKNAPAVHLTHSIVVGLAMKKGAPMHNPKP